MAKAYIVNPLALLAMRVGYNRPLDRADFQGGHVPGWAGCYVPGIGEPRRFAGLTVSHGADAAAVDTWANDTTQKHPLGTIATTKDGRIFRYTNVASAADLVAGNLIQSAAPIANHLALTSAAQAVGDGTGSKPIVVTPGATGGAANLYAEGTLMIDTTPGNGLTYRISGHAAITSATAFNLFLDPDETIQVALTSASRYGLHHNPWKTVIQAPTTLTARAVGVAGTIITASGFGWLQTRGPAAALINGTPAVNAPVINSATTAGALDVWTAAAQPTANFIGHMMQVGVSGKNNAVFLEID